MTRRPLAFGATIAVCMAVIAVAAGLLLGLPLRDPDSMVGPGYVRLPAFLVVVFAGDVVVRGVRRAGTSGSLLGSFRTVVRERWTPSRLAYAMAGLLVFYVCYVANRSFKSYAPFLGDKLWDEPLARADAVLLGGADVPGLLHDVLGTGIAAHVLSVVYLLYLAFIPTTLALALVWKGDPGLGMSYVNALCVNWLLGSACYLLLPSLGPVYTDPTAYNDLAPTGVTALQRLLWDDRTAVLADPTGPVMYGIGAFASLHVSILFTAALFAHRVGLGRRVRVVAWVWFALTTVATVYFGWHYVLDDVAGLAIGWVAVEAALRTSSITSSVARPESAQVLEGRLAPAPGG